MLALPLTMSNRFDELYQKYSNKLFRLCLSILSNKTDAEDVVQDVFIKYLEKQPEFNDESHEEAWLVRISVNACRDLLRKHKTRAYIPLEDLYEYGVTDEENRALKALSALPEQFRVPMVLHYLEGYSVEETAKLLKMTSSGVKMRLSRGRDILRAELE